MAGSIFNDEYEAYTKIGKDRYVNRDSQTIEKRSETVGRIITNFRLKRGYTQKEISNAIGIAQQTYAGYERGRHEPSIEILIRLAEIYGASLDILTGRYSNTAHEFIQERIIDEKIEATQNNDDEIEEQIELHEHREQAKKTRGPYNRAKRKAPR